MGRLHHQHNELGEIMHLGEPHQPTGVTVVFGGQAGSEGKGKIAGWLAQRYDWDAAVSTFMPNAGHTYVNNDGTSQEKRNIIGFADIFTGHREVTHEIRHALPENER